MSDTGDVRPRVTGAADSPASDALNGAEAWRLSKRNDEDYMYEDSTLHPDAIRAQPPENVRLGVRHARVPSLKHTHRRPRSQMASGGRHKPRIVIRTCCFLHRGQYRSPSRPRCH